MNNDSNTKLSPRRVFWKCGTCSQAMFHLINHEFSNEKPEEELASDLFAGGIVQKGHQCGMLWGGALAIGTEAYHKFDDADTAMASAICASKKLVDSFQSRTDTVNCREITNVDWENKLDSTIHMLKIIAQGFVFSKCFNLLVKWTPEAIQAANDGLSEETIPDKPCLSCASEVVKKMGAREEEAVMVAGLAGGIGLSGNACGALGAAIWYKMLKIDRKEELKSSERFNSEEARKILTAFYAYTNSEVLCSKISNKIFDNIDGHSDYIKNNGCKDLIEILAST